MRYARTVGWPSVHALGWITAVLGGLAPTLLRVLGQPVPRIKEGRVLEEGLLEKKAERTLAAV
jgi:hypothetical protein